MLSINVIAVLVIFLPAYLNCDTSTIRGDSGRIFAGFFWCMLFEFVDDNVFLLLHPDTLV